MGKAAYPTKLLWIDLEMTGLNPNEDRILEVGVIITDFEFNELATYESVVFQEQAELDRMKSAPWFEWEGSKRVEKGTVYDMAQNNGLLDKVKLGKAEAAVQKEVIELTKQHFEGPAVLAGNSIHQDRRFIRQWWPDFEKHLHYRMLDVTSFKVWMQGSRGHEFQKPDEHRALEDIRGSIEELQYYLDKLQS